MPGERVILFFLLQTMASSYAVARGGAPERIVGTSLLSAAALTAALQGDVLARFASVQDGVLAVDVALLIVLVATTLRADRFWTLWLTAIHVLGVGSHLVRFIDPAVVGSAYAFMLASGSYPMVALLVVGTLRHRQRISRDGTDHDWS